MKLKTLFSTILLASSGASFAQTWSSDSVAMGVGYANDVFYELRQGATDYHVGNDWHLGFQMTAFGDANFNASVRANHAKKGVEIYVLSNSATSTNFTNITAADTVGKTSVAQQLVNNDTSWGTGALYQNRNMADPFSFGWGEYAGPPSHALNGVSIYLLKVSNGPAYKLWVQKYVSMPSDSIRYIFRIAKLDGLDDRTVTIWRKGANKGEANTANFTNRLFAYYNVETDSVVNREPGRESWDMLFTQYLKIIPMGPGILRPQVYTGVLTNQSVEVADVRAIDVNDPDHLVNFKTYARSTRVDEIGDDWKTYMNPGPSGYYVMEDSTSYFVKTKTDNGYYQIYFTRFDGGAPSGQGKIVFNKRYLGSALSVNTVAAASLNAWHVSPNPTMNEASLMIDAKVATPSARLMVTDMSGRIVANTGLAINRGMNAYSLNTSSWPAGIYVVQVAGGDWKLSTRLVVVR